MLKEITRKYLEELVNTNKRLMALLELKPMLADSSVTTKNNNYTTTIWYFFCYRHRRVSWWILFACSLAKIIWRRSIDSLHTITYALTVRLNRYNILDFKCVYRVFVFAATRYDACLRLWLVRIVQDRNGEGRHHFGQISSSCKICTESIYWYSLCVYRKKSMSLRQCSGTGRSIVTVSAR